MNRRLFLAGTKIILTGIAGCLGNANNPAIPNKMIVETLHRSTNLLKDDKLVAEHLERDKPASYQTIITSEKEADERLRLNDKSDAFVQNTDFNESYLVLVVAGDWSSDITLELVEVERTEAGLHIGIETRSPSGDLTMDASRHSLLIRVTDERADMPNQISVEIDGKHAGTNDVN